MFEKSLYDLIRGLRNHKGNEREYIQESIRECRKEIKSQDMDLKATAVLKLTYLEMFGHDMSWASFNVLEVMSSAKYVQKRVGYLGAVQSFRPDTEVLMLAENLLKKDLTSSAPPTIALPLVAIPHVINPSMANSLLSDLLPRLTHSNAAIRKKTVVTLYRLALVFPETLRPAWPKIKERLQDEGEDPSVTAAIVNVVCELGWRRPQDFLPLAPRLFDLLVQAGNNWMAIKIIKLFATLTPLEPRLVKKLLPPLTSIIKTTPAMSLLYECINGIIQGGILDNSEGVAGEELARLCVGKLRGMLVVESDPNLKYVALLSFNKIVAIHPELVSLHQDVILECVDDPDISIRSRALDLVVGMINSDNLPGVVDRLMRQLRLAPLASAADDPRNDRGVQDGVVPAAESDDEEAEESLRTAEHRSKEPPPLPEEYRVNVIKQILQMCNRDTYVNIADFEWYIDILVQLVKVSPPSRSIGQGQHPNFPESKMVGSIPDVSFDIGSELQNVAVRVRAVRPEATRAAQSLVLFDKRDQMFPAAGNGGRGVLEAAIWLVGEYADLLTDAEGVLASLLHPSTLHLPDRMLAVQLQAIPKVFATIAGNQQIRWSRERKTTVILLLARITHFLEPLATHPSLEIQERAVEYLELMRLASEAASNQPTDNEGEILTEPPLLLTQAIPGLFRGFELNPVAPGAQRKVPPPEDLDLNIPINEHLHGLLAEAEKELESEVEEDDSYRFYNEKQAPKRASEAAADRLEALQSEPVSYQQTVNDDSLDVDTIARRKNERKERYKDDPFYIDNDGISGDSTPLHNILRNSNGVDVDIDSIPIMDLDLNDNDTRAQAQIHEDTSNVGARPKRRKQVEIIVDETLGPDEESASETNRPGALRIAQSKAKKSLLEVDSSGLGSLPLEGDGNGTELDFERRQAEELEMAKALREVERLRLEMQRASERVQPKDAPPEGTLVKKKKRKVKKAETQDSSIPGEGALVKKKKKKKVKEGDPEAVEDETAVKAKKKRRQIQLEPTEGPSVV